MPLGPEPCAQCLGSHVRPLILGILYQSFVLRCGSQSMVSDTAKASPFPLHFLATHAQQFIVTLYRRIFADDFNKKKVTCVCVFGQTMKSGIARLSPSFLFAFVPLNPTTPFPEPRVAYLRPSKNNCITSHRQSLNLLSSSRRFFAAAPFCIVVRKKSTASAGHQALHSKLNPVRV